MVNYIKVDKDNTELSEYGLTYGHVLDGRKAELEPEKKTKRREDYILADTVNTIVSDYAADLLEAYESNESMESYIADMEAKLEEASEAFTKSQEQVESLLESQGELTEIENAMATLDQQMEQIAKERESGNMENSELRSELEETYANLQAEKERVDTISMQVEEVMTNLESYFDEEGIVIDSEEDYEDEEYYEEV